VLFDTDETLVDPTQVVELAWRQWVVRHHISEDVSSFSRERPTIAVLELFLPRANQSEELDKLSRFDCQARHGIFSSTSKPLLCRAATGHATLCMPGCFLSDCRLKPSALRP
jgi:hypothetical protein